MLPRHHAACSRTSAFSCWRSLISGGTPPPSTTALVFVVEAMFVSAQADSKINSAIAGLAVRFVTKMGKTPAPNTRSTGGSRSTERILRNPRVASICRDMGDSEDFKIANISGISCTVLYFFLVLFWTVESPPAADGTATLPNRRFLNTSSFLFLRICLLVSSRRRLPSLASTVFLKAARRSGTKRSRRERGGNKKQIFVSVICSLQYTSACSHHGR